MKNAAGRILIVILEYGSGATGVECKKDPRFLYQLLSRLTSSSVP